MTDWITGIFGEQAIIRNTIATGILIVSIMLLRSAALRFVRRAEWSSDQMHLRWTVQVRWASLLLLILGLVIVWATELQTLALSVVAIAVAVVLATKELILCLSGSVLRVVSRGYTLGDRIEVAGIRGDVVDTGALTTTILETGSWHRRTGRAVVIPNSVLLTAPVTNETFTDDFVLHTISIPLDTTDDWQDDERRLLAAASQVCGPFIAEAKHHMRETVRRHGLPDFVVEPRVDVHVPEAGRLKLVLRIPCRARERGQTEQQVLRQFLERKAEPSTEDKYGVVSER